MNKQTSSAPSASHESLRCAQSTSLAMPAPPVFSTISADRKADRPASLTYLAPASFVSMADICARVKRSKSWMYENDVVPIIDDEGKHINNDKVPPPPWEQLPKPRIEVGKKLWLAADIEVWLRRLDVRTYQSADDSIASPKARRKVTP